MAQDPNFLDPAGNAIQPQAFVDYIGTLDMQERNGVVRELTRVVRVCGLVATDYNVLYLALIVPGVPQTGDGISFPNQPFITSMLRLAERKSRLLESDPTKVEITCIYRHVLDGAQEVIDQGLLFGRIHTSLKQVPTNFYTDYDDPNNPVFRQLSVSHTFPAAPNFIFSGLNNLIQMKLNVDPDYAGQTLTQGGTINILVPGDTYTVEFFINLLTMKPTDIRNALIQAVNKERWMNGAPFTWLCTDIAYECVDYTRNRWKFRVEWQYDPDTWYPDVVFEDKRIGQPPAGLVPGVGYWNVPYYYPVNFADAFLPDYRVTFAEDPG